MKLRTSVTLVRLAALVILGTSAVAFAATQRKVSGIITQVEPTTLSIQPMHGKKSVSGKLAGTTRVLVDGKAAHISDLRVSCDAKAELGLDEVWISVRAGSQ